MIELKNIHLQMATKVLIESSSLKVGKKEFVALVGNNGSGKSTLLRVIRKEVSSEGTIEIDGQNVQLMDEGPLSRLMSVALSGRQYIPSVSVREVLHLSRMPFLSWSAKLDDSDLSLIDHYSKEFEIDDFLDRMIDSLSDGEYQKVMAARCFVQDTPAILMDEPSAFLDIKQKRNLFQRLRQESDRGKCILIATHDLHEALEFCDKIVVLDGGKLMSFAAKSQELLTNVNRIFGTKF